MGTGRPRGDVAVTRVSSGGSLVKGSREGEKPTGWREAGEKWPPWRRKVSNLGLRVLGLDPQSPTPYQLWQPVRQSPLLENSVSTGPASPFLRWGAGVRDPAQQGPEGKGPHPRCR